MDSFEKTFWNGLPNPARRVMVRVGDNVPATWWCAKLAGTTRKAVAVRNHDGSEFYLDDEDGNGWAKVTLGRGGPEYGHSGLPDNSVVLEARHG